MRENAKTERENMEELLDFVTSILSGGPTASKTDYKRKEEFVLETDIKPYVRPFKQEPTKLLELIIELEKEVDKFMVKDIIEDHPSNSDLSILSLAHVIVITECLSELRGSLIGASKIITADEAEIKRQFTNAKVQPSNFVFNTVFRE